MLIRLTLAMVLGLAAGYAQDGPPARGRGPFDPPSGFGGGRPGVRFLGAEAGRSPRVVKNAPYAADMVTERVQTLTDGNRIRQTASARVYRDSEGRTRREQALNSLGGLAPGANLSTVVFIDDPVAGATYALNTRERTATKSPRSVGGRGMERASSGDGMRPRQEAWLGNNLKSEALGRQTIEGLPADGTRTTFTIPSGRVGNEQPLLVVTETWYSQDLQAVVLAKRSDPRSGETVTRLANISRSEPARALFEIPGDFKVTEGPRRMLLGSQR